MQTCCVALKKVFASHTDNIGRLQRVLSGFAGGGKGVSDLQNIH